MALAPFDRAVWGLLAVVTVAILGLVWRGDQVGVAVVRALPAENGPLGPWSPVGLEFSQAMQPAQLEALWQTTPPARGRLIAQNRQVWFSPEGPFAPGQVYTMTLPAGALSVEGRVTQAPFHWSFRVRTPAIAYLSRGASPYEIWRVEADGTGARPLTQTGGRVDDFAVSADGEHIVYAVINDQRGSNLWVMTRDGQDARLMLDCEMDRCHEAAWSPDGTRLAYSRRMAWEEPGKFGAPQLWLVELAGGRTMPVLPAPDSASHEPRWSPDGRWVAFYDGRRRGIHAVDVLTGAEEFWPGSTNAMGSWLPGTPALLYTRLARSAGAPTVSLWRADATTGQTVEVPTGASDELDYRPPAVAPAGDWLATVMSPGGDAPPAFPQLWAFQLAGSQRLPVSTVPGTRYEHYAWDPWGHAVVFEHYPIEGTGVPHTIRIWSRLRPDEPARAVAPDGIMPAWLP